MGYVTLIVLSFLITWGTLMIVTPLAGRLAGFSFPGWKTAAWQLAVIALATSAASALGELAAGWVGWILGMVVFWTLMVKWFEVNFLGAVLIVLISWLIRTMLVAMLVAAL